MRETEAQSRKLPQVMDLWRKSLDQPQVYLMTLALPSFFQRAVFWVPSLCVCVSVCLCVCVSAWAVSWPLGGKLDLGGWTLSGQWGRGCGEEGGAGGHLHLFRPAFMTSRCSWQGGLLGSGYQDGSRSAARMLRQSSFRQLPIFIPVLKPFGL